MEFIIKLAYDHFNENYDWSSDLGSSLTLNCALENVVNEFNIEISDELYNEVDRQLYLRYQSY